MVAGDRNDPKVRDEACLTLTVWSPDVSASLPVMVWIPGGAFLNGAGQLQLYNGSRLAANGDVVVVNVTYRVGVFGGFELGDLGEGFDDNLMPAAGRRLQRTWLEFARAAGQENWHWSSEWPEYDAGRRKTTVFRSASTVVVDDPDGLRRSAWSEVFAEG